jgi:uncharacterized protein YfaT (DUF1175 family)
VLKEGPQTYQPVDGATPSTFERHWHCIADLRATIDLHHWLLKNRKEDYQYFPHLADVGEQFHISDHWGQFQGSFSRVSSALAVKTAPGFSTASVKESTNHRGVESAS